MTETTFYKRPEAVPEGSELGQQWAAYLAAEAGVKAANDAANELTRQAQEARAFQETAVFGETDPLEFCAAGARAELAERAAVAARVRHRRAQTHFEGVRQAWLARWGGYQRAAQKLGAASTAQYLLDEEEAKLVAMTTPPA